MYLAAILTMRRFFARFSRSEEHTSELQSRSDLVCRLLLEKKKKQLYTSIRGEGINTSNTKVPYPETAFKHVLLTMSVSTMFNTNQACLTNHAILICNLPQR